MEKFIPEKCSCCRQTLTYLVPVDKGTVEIVRAIAFAVQKKGINIIHPRREMEVSGHTYEDWENLSMQGLITSNQVGNLSKARFHGLIARVKDNPGNYCLTDKGLEFLRGEPVPKYAVVQKSTHTQIGYWRPEEYRVSTRDFRADCASWETGLYFQIIQGRVVKQLNCQRVLL